MHAFPNGGKGTITLKAGAFGDRHIEIVVSDDGCGMSPQIRHHAFDPSSAPAVTKARLALVFTS